MPANFTDITILLDDSGSMWSTKGLTLESLRSFIKEQQEVPGEAVVSLVKFHQRGHLRTVLDAFPLRAVDTEAIDYDPRGSHTALRDAWLAVMEKRGKAFSAMPEGLRPNKVLFVVITDGLDNDSFTTREHLNSKVTHQRDVYQWQFIYLGANQDAEAVGQGYGIPAEQSMTYTAGFFDEATKAVGSTVASYRQHGFLRSFTAAEKAAAAKGEPK